jgi:hypothetical protein
MAQGKPTPTLRFLHQLIGYSADEAATDGGLLDRFLQRREEAAFAALVRRHGPMV